jgi:putative glutamine amidotransferase
MTRRPVILISPCLDRAGEEFDDDSVSLSDCYSDAIFDAGGLPWILPRIPSRELALSSISRADGLLLTGGNDIEAALHRPRLPAKLRPKAGAPDLKRDLLELMLISEAFQARKPLLAICRGHQILNVALGGDLLIDIASERPGALKHNCSDLKDGWAHEINIAPGSLMRKIAGRRTLRVNSCHHQAVNRLAKSLRATATSSDGIIEAMEPAGELLESGLFLLAVQFHPERLCRAEPVFDRIFAAFVAACAAAAKSSL